jgi:hypothetical protein
MCFVDQRLGTEGHAQGHLENCHICSLGLGMAMAKVWRRSDAPFRRYREYRAKNLISAEE